MSVSQSESQLALEAARLKQEAVRFDARANRVLGALVLAGVLVGLATWFCQKPIDRDANLVSAATALGLATMLLGGLLDRMLHPIPRAVCPQCGCDWKSESDNDHHKWLAWDHCPGCGLDLSCDVESDEKPCPAAHSAQREHRSNG